VRAHQPAGRQKQARQQRQLKADQVARVGELQRHPTQQEVGQRDEQQKQAHKVLCEPAGREKQQALHGREPRPQGAPTQKQRLDGAPAPAFALHKKALDRLGRQAHAQALVQVHGAVAMAQHDQGGEQVFGDAFGRDAARCIQRLTPHDAARAAAKRSVPGVARSGHLVKKQALFVRVVLHQAQIGLDRVLVVKVLGRLDDAHARVHKQAQGAPDETPRGHKIGIEHGHKRPSDVLQRVVEVARFGVQVVGPRQIAHAVAGAIGLQPIPTAIVQHPDRLVRVIDRLRTQDGFSSTSSGSL